MTTAPSNEAETAPDAPAVPPFLRRVRIRGYKSIVFCDVSLEPLTILVGRNASGKSNFLDALAFLRDAAQFNVKEAINRRGGMGSLLCLANDAKAFSIEVESIDLDPTSGKHYRINYGLTVPLHSGGWASWPSESFRMTPPSGEPEMGFTSQDGAVNWFGAWSAPFAGSAKVDSADHLVLTLFGHPGDAHLSKWLHRMRFHNFSPEPMRAPRRPVPGLYLERDGGNLASVIEGTLSHDPVAFQRVARYLRVITESVELLGVDKFGAYQTVRFAVPRTGQQSPLEFDAASMSDGTLRALAALMSVYQVPLPDQLPSLVAIEEPETALHATAMRALVDALDEATVRTQILLTTHSADMLDNPTIRPENVRVVQMIDAQTVIGPVDEASVQIVRQNLDTLGGLERQNQLDLDSEDLHRQRKQAGSNGQEPKE